jgi:hypothetical protein
MNASTIKTALHECYAIQTTLHECYNNKDNTS